MKRRKRNSIVAFVLILFGAVSCSNNNVYFQYCDVNPEAWHQDSLYTFTVDVEDVASLYNVYIHVRNTPDYPNQNLWLFLSELTPDSAVVSDTIEFYLADHRGQWLGSGAGSVKEMPVLYRQGFRFDRPGTYTYTIGHGMRTNPLKGISEIGMRVEKLATSYELQATSGVVNN